MCRRQAANRSRQEVARCVDALYRTVRRAELQLQGASAALRRAQAIIVYAAQAFGWHRFVGIDRDTVTMNRFGASALGGTCMEKFGFTVGNVVSKSNALLG